MIRKFNKLWTETSKKRTIVNYDEVCDDNDYRMPGICDKKKNYNSTQDRQEIKRCNDDHKFPINKPNLRNRFEYVQRMKNCNYISTKENSNIILNEVSRKRHSNSSLSEKSSEKSRKFNSAEVYKGNDCIMTEICDRKKNYHSTQGMQEIKRFNDNHKSPTDKLNSRSSVEHLHSTKKFNSASFKDVVPNEVSRKRHSNSSLSENSREKSRKYNDDGKKSSLLNQKPRSSHYSDQKTEKHIAGLTKDITRGRSIDNISVKKRYNSSSSGQSNKKIHDEKHKKSLMKEEIIKQNLLIKHAKRQIKTENNIKDKEQNIRRTYSQEAIDLDFRTDYGCSLYIDDESITLPNWIYL